MATTQLAAPDSIEVRVQHVMAKDAGLVGQFLRNFRTHEFLEESL